MQRTLDHDERTVSRRLFLKTAAAVGGGLIIGWVPEGNAADGADAAQLFAPNAFVRIDRTGNVTVVSPMVEMGQGIYTSLPMLVAEELDFDMSSVGVEHSPPNDELYGNPFLDGVQMTGGSSSIRGFYLPCHLKIDNHHQRQIRRPRCHQQRGGPRQAQCRRPLRHQQR